MKLCRIIAAGISAAWALVAMPAFAQQQATGQGDIYIIDEFAVSRTSHLDFGTFTIPTGGSKTITIDEIDGARSLTGPGTVTTVGGGNARATFRVEGEAALDFLITVDPTLTLTRVSGSETILVDLVPSAASGTIGGTPGSAGTANFGVGGSFTIGTATVPGAYEGTFTVSVDNN